MSSCCHGLEARNRLGIDRGVSKLVRTFNRSDDCFLLDEKWADLTTGANAVFPIDIIYANVSTCEGNCSEVYGNLYNWYAVDDSRDVCPEGWHVPTDEEWIVLTDYLGGESVAGGKMKETGLEH